MVLFISILNIFMLLNLSYMHLFHLTNHNILKIIIKSVMFPDLGPDYMCLHHSLIMLLECKTVDYVLYMRCGLLQYRQLGIQRRHHKQHLKCHLWQCWGIYDWCEEVFINVQVMS